MRKMLKNIFYLFIVLVFFNSCQSLKEGLTGQKKSNSDEFLIQKKNPLVQPPEFDELPEPKILIKSDKKDNDIDLQTILKKDNTKTKIIPVNKNLKGSIEKSILEKIKSN